MGKYVSVDSIVEYLKELRMNANANTSPYMDNALLNVQQLIEFDQYNPCIFNFIDIGSCNGCKWRGRWQKCTCCRRNIYIKDCYESEEESHETD